MEVEKWDEKDCQRKQKSSHYSQQDVDMSCRNSGWIFAGVHQEHEYVEVFMHLFIHYRNCRIQHSIFKN